MSLTTAISDEDDAESNPGNLGGGGGAPYKSGMSSKATSSQQQGGSAASFNCTGAVRKAGFLSVKKWLLRKKHQVRKRTYGHDFAFFNPRFGLAIPSS